MRVIRIVGPKASSKPFNLSSLNCLIFQNNVKI